MRKGALWLLPVLFTLVLAATGLQLGLIQRQPLETTAATVQPWFVRKLLGEKANGPAGPEALQTTQQCFDSPGGQPEQRVCVFEDLVVHNGQLYYVTNNASDSVPPVKIAWLSKFEGDDMLRVAVVNQSQLPFQWEGAEVEELPQVGLFHQQHFSNFYHLVTEVAPTMHFILCKFLGDCSYSAESRLRLLFVQEQRPNIPTYIIPNSVADTFRCISPTPVSYSYGPEMQNKVFILRRAVAGVSNEVRAFPEWKEEHEKNYREPPRDFMVTWRQRLADCFGFNFTQFVAPTDPLRILFINRHYEEGRMILNQAKIAHQIEKMPELQAFPSVNLKLHFLNSDDSIKDQAALFANTSLLIWPHGATMTLTQFLPRGAQAIEVIPWVEEEKGQQQEWVQAIRDAFGLEIDLYAVQNKERKRVMFNQDGLLDYAKYREASPKQKVALLERGECPAGVDPFDCPFWWNHWKVSVNLDWATIEPALKSALGKLAELRKAGGVLPPRTTGGPRGEASAASAAAAGASSAQLQEGDGSSAAGQGAATTRRLH